jgi:hypothetical protein
LYNTSVQTFDLQWTDEGVATVVAVPDDASPVTLRCEPFVGVTGANLTVGGDELGSPTLQLGDRRWHWQWQPRGRTGRFAVCLRVERRNAPPLVFDSALAVAPGKIDRDAYEHLLDALQRAAVGLVLNIAGGQTPASWQPDSGAPRSIVEDYWTRLQAETAAATATVDRLTRSAYETWQHDTEERELHDIAVPRADALARMVERPLEETSAPFATNLPNTHRGTAHKPRLPRTLPVRSMVPTTHRYEHSILVRVLLELHARCAFVREALARELAWRASGASDAAKTAHIGVLREWQQQINVAAAALLRARGVRLLADVEPVRAWKGTTELMRRDRRYRAIAQAWQTLWQRPFVAVHSPAFDLPIDDLPSLYERWCVLEIVRALCDISEPIEHHLFVADEGAKQGIGPTVWNVRLGEDRPLVRCRAPDGAEWRVWYHRRFAPNVGQGPQLGSLDPFLRVPDVVLEAVKPGASPRLLIFDAKYRLTATGNVSEDALETAYAYHGGLGYAGLPASVGSFLLFPGTEAFEAGGVGALPMVPGAPSKLAEVICQRMGGTDEDPSF